MDRLIRYPSAALALRLLLALAVPAAPVLGAAECFFPDGTRHGEGIPCDPNASGPVTCCERTHSTLGPAAVASLARPREHAIADLTI